MALGLFAGVGVGSSWAVCLFIGAYTIVKSGQETVRIAGEMTGS